MKRHPLDLFSLLSGLTFVTIAVLYLLDAAGQLSVNGRLVIPLLLVALGVAGLAAAVHRIARSQRGAAEPDAPSAAVRPAVEEPHGSSRYEELSTDLEALGLLDEPTAPERPDDRP
ncbi:hypothetical protein [Streptacidiphilus cavernicola]|uniref:Uncharacterized protein n=1 Tax=Streptacidiphilus cavernicola TaxID=3342716 RepID=A0ABV6VTQ3_9ACTN